MASTIEELNELIAEELKLWGEIPFSPAQINQDLFLAVTKLEALADFLIQKGIVDEEELVIHLKEFLLAKLKTLRPQIEDAMRLRRIESIKPHPSFLDIDGNLN